MPRRVDIRMLHFEDIKRTNDPAHAFSSLAKPITETAARHIHQTERLMALKEASV